MALFLYKVKKVNEIKPPKDIYLRKYLNRPSLKDLS